MKRLVFFIGMLLAVGAVLVAGFVAVRPGEAVVVRRLGRVVPRPLDAGPHWVLPFGVDRLDRVRTDEVRRLTVGLGDVPGPLDDPGAGEFLTGDLNLLRLEAAVQYRVDGPVAFALLGDRAEAMLGRLAESALSTALSKRTIDDALRDARPAIAAEAAEALADESDRLGLGLAVLGVSLTDARPPAEVRPDFAAAQAARSEADRRVREAEGHAERVLAAAAAESAARLDRAHAGADRTVALASASADRFRALQAEVGRARSLAIPRLYVDAMRTLLPGVGRAVVLDPGEPLDLSLFGAEGGAAVDLPR